MLLEEKEEQEGEMKIRNVLGTTLQVDPKKESCNMQFLFVIYKIFRMYYVTWGYYFTPITALFLNLIYNLKQNDAV